MTAADVRHEFGGVTKDQSPYQGCIRQSPYQGCIRLNAGHIAQTKVHADSGPNQMQGAVQIDPQSQRQQGAVQLGG